MISPIFNAMMRIDRGLVEAAIDGGARFRQVISQVILPLCKPGIAIGSIFVVTMVMGDFITVRFMSGGQSASVGLMIYGALGVSSFFALVFRHPLADAAARAAALPGAAFTALALATGILNFLQAQ